NFICGHTQTPNISFDEMKQLGALSGVAFDRVFIDAHLATRHEVDGEYLQRDLHLTKVLVASLGSTEKAAVSGLILAFEVPNFKLDDIESDVDLAAKLLIAGLLAE